MDRRIDRRMDGQTDRETDTKIIKHRDQVLSFKLVNPSSVRQLTVGSCCERLQCNITDMLDFHWFKLFHQRDDDDAALMSTPSS